MTTGLTYSQYVDQIANLAIVPTTDPNFQILIPQMVTYAENRIYRDLDLLSTVTTYNQAATASGVRNVTIPQGTFVTIQNVNALTNTTTRNPLLPVTKEFLDNVWGASTNSALPKYFALLNDTTLIFGPWPNAIYPLEIIGTIRPDSLSSTNTTTFISLYLPDLFIMASMVFISAYQRNFGRQSDSPEMAVSYESQYQTLLKGAMVEEYRKKFESVGWTSMSPSPVAAPTRG